MGMPQIPDGTNRPNIEEVIIDLLESIALEEMALSHILNAEGEKLQAVVCNFKNNQIDICDLNSVSKSINLTISNVIVKEWLLLTKFNNVKELADSSIIYNKECNCYKPKSCEPNPYNKQNKYN